LSKIKFSKKKLLQITFIIFKTGPEDCCCCCCCCWICCCEGICWVCPEDKAIIFFLIKIF